MSDAVKPAAMEATAVPPGRASRGYPEPFATRVAGRERQALGDAFGLTNFWCKPNAIASGLHVGAAPHPHA